MTTLTQYDPAARAVAAGEVITTLSAQIVAAVDDLAVLVAGAVEADHMRRAALGQLGTHDRRPPVAELLAEMLHGRLGALRPHIPYVSTDAAQRAAAALASTATKETQP